MLAPKCSTYNDRPTFSNPLYLKQAQSKKPCLYEIPYDTSDLANIFAPEREETLTLDQESRSKLNKDLVKPYDYTKQNSLYEIFKPPSQEHLQKLARANEIRRKMWRKSFVKTKPNIVKNIERHTYDKFRAPTTEDMDSLLKVCLIPLALKTQNDSFIFVHELKQEMFVDFQYVQSLEKEINKLESDKADFSNIYDLLLQECMSKDVMCSYLHSLSDLDAYTKLQCLYLHKVKECEYLAEKPSKQIEFVNEKVYNELSRSFAKLEKHSISLELDLQNCKEKLKNDTVWKENESKVFLKEQEQYHEIQDLKAQLQDKNIAISELKKLIEKLKGKGVDTNFEQPSILGKPPFQPIKNQPVKSSFAKPYDVNAPGPSRNRPKHVSFQSPRESVGSNDMVHNYYLEEAKKNAQLQKDKDWKSKPSMITPDRLPRTANDCKPKPRILNQQPRNRPASMSSRVSNKDVHIAAKPRKQKPFLKSKDLPCPTCKKCIYSANHD
ncbi:hypothetical protein Tco_1030993 [Tanacetum coccineum]|uniref:Uncharacterized protein n=1 Tax=Tanacetum coccineum TaxID=301880 RepID=A0ABQ5GA18_9ASTR